MQIPLPEHPHIIFSEGTRAIFEIDGLYPGYGMTIGNALRRIMVSSLPGAAITTAKIKGVSHEFSTIPHVLEDVVEIMLNLKQVRMKLHGSESQWVSLKVKGEREVKARDIHAPSQVEIVNPGHHIAMLTDKKADLEMDLEVQHGIGYETREGRRREKVEIGTIALDAIYSPIRRADYEIEDMRVGERTDYNRLRIAVETDGTITPQEALIASSEILVDHFARLKEIGIAKIEERAVDGSAPHEESATGADATKFKLSQIKLPTRIVNILVKNGIKTVAGLLRKNGTQLGEIEGLGPAGVKEVKKALGRLGLTLR